MNSIIVRLQQRARSRRGCLALQSLPSLPACAVCLPCLPAGRGRRRSRGRGRSGRGRARRAMQMSGGDGQLCFPMSLRNSSAASLNSSLQTLYFPQNTGSQALGELAVWANSICSSHFSDFGGSLLSLSPPPVLLSLSVFFLFLFFINPLCFHLPQMSFPSDLSY